jgi:hypothetical protein
VKSVRRCFYFPEGSLRRSTLCPGHVMLMRGSNGIGMDVT